MNIELEYLRKLIKEELDKEDVDINYGGYKSVINESVLDVNQNLDDAFELIEDHNLLKESEDKIEELKIINNEIRRMKQLVDFRSPLLSNDNL